MAITEFKYNPTNWDSNVAITPSRLNKIEQSLCKVGDILQEISTSLEILDNKITSVKGDIAKELNIAVADAKNETEKIIFNYDKTIASVIADYKDDMDNRFIALDDYKTEVISAGTAAADNFLIGKGVDLEDLKAWRVDKEAKDTKRDLWQKDVDTWKGEAITHISNQDVLISEIDSKANEAKTTATAAANTATSAANTATTAANNIDSQIWAGNQNLTNSFKTLLNSDDARSIINKNAKIAIGRTFGMNPADDADIDTEILKNSLKETTNQNVTSLGFALSSTVGALGQDLTQQMGTLGQDLTQQIAAFNNRGYVTNSQVKNSITRQLGTAFGMTLSEDSQIDASTLQVGLRAYTADAILTGTGLKTGEGENHSLVTELNTIKDSFKTITEQVNLLKTAVEELQSSSGSGSSNFGNLWTGIHGNEGLNKYVASGAITGGFNNAFNNNNNITDP